MARVDGWGFAGMPETPEAAGFLGRHHPAQLPKGWPDASLAVEIRPACGQMWPDWGLVQDVYSFAKNALPCGGAERRIGLLRTSIKWCVWLGRPDCYRNQDAVLEPPSPNTKYPSGTPTEGPVTYDVHPSGLRFNNAGFNKALAERGGVTPRNLLVCPIGTAGYGHPAVTPYRLAEWWCRYLLPPGGVLIDPFCGSGTTMAAALACGASKVIGIDKEEDYLDMARRRILGEGPAPIRYSTRLTGCLVYSRAIWSGGGGVF